MDFAQARYYNFRHGRFTSVDPLMASADIINPQTFNRYAYVGNNPTTLNDPSGEIWGISGDTIRWFNTSDAMKAAGFTASNIFAGYIGEQLYALNPNSRVPVAVASSEAAIQQLVTWGIAGGAVVSTGATLGLTAAGVAAIAVSVAALYAPEGSLDGRPEPVRGLKMSKWQTEYYQNILNENTAESGSNSSGASEQSSGANADSAKPNPNDNEPTDHAKEKREEARSGNANRAVGDPNRVAREGRRYRDTDSGYTVYVKGNRVVIYDGEQQVTQFKNTKRNTQSRIKSGKWIPF